MPLQTPSPSEQETLDETRGRTGGHSSAGGQGLPAPQRGQAGRLSGQLLGGASSEALRLLGRGRGRLLSAPPTPGSPPPGEAPPPMMRSRGASGQGEGMLCSYTLPAISSQSSLYDSG